MFFKSFRAAAPDPARGAYSAPLDPQLVFTWADPLFLTVRRPCTQGMVGVAKKVAQLRNFDRLYLGHFFIRNS